MANLSIRKLNDAIYKRLQKRAKLHAVSIEEEVRQVITQAVMSSEPQSVSAVFKKCFGPKNGIELSLPHRRKPHHPVDFN